MIMELSTTRVIVGLRMLRSEHDLVYLLLNYNAKIEWRTTAKAVKGTTSYSTAVPTSLTRWIMKKIEVSIRAKLLLNQKMIGTEQGDL